MKPDSLLELIGAFKSLPGISRKQAERISNYILFTDKTSAGETLINKLKFASDNLRRCSRCNHITEDETCYICNDESRTNILVIVESSLDVFKFEDTQEQFKPMFHVLGGLINLTNNKTFDDLYTDNLIQRANKVSEVILALSPNLEGIVTANYLKDYLVGVKVTQLAQGIPLGAAMEYVDELTLKAAINNRKDVK